MPKRQVTVNDLTKFLILPGLKLIGTATLDHRKGILYECETKSTSAFCPHCGLETKTVHDRRKVTIKDSPLWERKRILLIKKKRYRCEGLGCKKVFTESIPGINKRARLTQKFQRHLLFCAQKFSNLKDVKANLKIGNKTLYKRQYDQLELKASESMNNPWPKTIGIDEHSFIKNKKYGYREFATMIVDYDNKKVRELVPGRNAGQLELALNYIPDKHRVQNVCMDLSSTYRSFARRMFPQANIIADKFHVVRLLNPAINKHRKALVGDRRKAKIGRYLLMNSRRLHPTLRFEIRKWLEDKPALRKLYATKEAILKLYRTKGHKKARSALIKLTDYLATEQLKELKTLRKTLRSWMDEILNHFKTGLTNARTEGYNNVCKQLQKRAYGYRSFKNYRLRVLYACR